VERILVSLNIREGLWEFLNLTDLGQTRVQILDYEGVPFRCRRCHEYGHIVMDCKKSSRGHFGSRSSDVSRPIQERQEDTGGNSSSSVSTSVGTQSSRPDSSPDHFVKWTDCSRWGMLWLLSRS
jgi:hypothetical protein